MKRVGNLWEKIIDIDNIKLAHQRARKDKTFYREVKMVDSNIDYYAGLIHDMLADKTYVVSKYRRQVINDSGKERTLMKLQYFPDRIIQWAIMLQLEPIFLNTFCKHTCASIPKRGLKRAWNMVRGYIDKDQVGTKYCFKMDVKKFYDSIDHDILKSKLRAKLKDKDLLSLLDTIIDSYPGNIGVPIGSYLSQYFANFYLSKFDHFLKEKLQIKYCVRYMDDVVIFASTKKILHNYIYEIKQFLDSEKLVLKSNYQVFSTGCRGVDFIGFRFFPHYTLLRKKNKEKFKEVCSNVGADLSFTEFCSINSYNGWLLLCDSFRLRKQYIDPIKKYVFRYYALNIPRKYGRQIKSFNNFVAKFNSKKGVKTA